MDVANKASLRVDSAHFSGDAATNVVVVRGTGFTGEHVSEGVEVTIFELDSEGKAQGEAIKSVFVKPSEIVDGSLHSWKLKLQSCVQGTHTVSSRLAIPRVKNMYRHTQ